MPIDSCFKRLPSGKYLLMGSLVCISSYSMEIAIDKKNRKKICALSAFLAPEKMDIVFKDFEMIGAVTRHTGYEDNVLLHYDALKHRHLGNFNLAQCHHVLEFVLSDEASDQTRYDYIEYMSKWDFVRKQI